MRRIGYVIGIEAVIVAVGVVGAIMSSPETLWIWICVGIAGALLIVFTYFTDPKRRRSPGIFSIEEQERLAAIRSQERREFWDGPGMLIGLITVACVFVFLFISTLVLPALLLRPPGME